MRITLANTHDLVGGAERCSYDLARHLHTAGDDVELLVGRKLGDDPFVRQMVYREWDWKLRAAVHDRYGLTDTTIMAPLYGCWRIPSLRDTDVYNIHNMHGGYWNFWTLPILARRAPLVLTLHDEWLLTGDCAYTYECERWLGRCGRCPQALEPDPYDRVCIGGADSTRLNLTLKRAAIGLLSGPGMDIVTPSAWLAERVERAPHLSRFRCQVIYNGVDTALFKPEDRKVARQRLDLPADDFVVLCLAANLYDQRKNVRAVLDASRSSAWPDGARLIIAGKMDESLERAISGNPRCLPVGFLSDKREVARLLSASDLLLLPSRADNLPYAALEAQACGCPVLAARVGGIPESIEEKRTGWLFEPDTQGDALASRVGEIAALPATQLEEMRGAARAHCLRHFSLETFAAAYRRLFEERIASRRTDA
jgi:glycosyltransferase involved in cell wall biosynthesis